MSEQKGSELHLKELAEKLQGYSFVSKFDDDEPEAWRLAHSLCDVEESLNEILNKFLPVLRKSDDAEAINEALLDIGEEFRHILYHIKDPKFYRYLLEEE